MSGKPRTANERRLPTYTTDTAALVYYRRGTMIGGLLLRSRTQKSRRAEDSRGKFPEIFTGASKLILFSYCFFLIDTIYAVQNNTGVV